jgi:hypothetical protein
MSQVHLATARRDDSGKLSAVIKEYTSAVVTSEVARSQTEWCRSVAPMKDMLAVLVAACDAATNPPAYAPDDAALRELVASIIAAAKVDGEAALKKLEADAREKALEHRATVDKLETQLASQGEEIRIAHGRLSEERTCRMRAETAAAEASALAQRAQAQTQADRAELERRVQQLETERRSAHEQLHASVQLVADERTARAQAERSVETVRQALTSEMSEMRERLQKQTVAMAAQDERLSELRDQMQAGELERAKLVATLDTVNKAVQRAVLAMDPAAVSSLPVAAAQASVVPPTPAPEAGRAQASEPKKKAEPRAETAPPNASGPGTTGAATRRAAGEAQASTATPPENGAAWNCATDLLNQAESMYWDDLNSGLQPLEVVTRLTDNLRHAAELFIARFPAAAVDAPSIFEQYVTRAIDLHAATSFGRHLGIAAYELRPA